MISEFIFKHFFDEIKCDFVKNTQVNVAHIGRNLTSPKRRNGRKNIKQNEEP